MPLTFGSLFAGIGGMDLGFEMAGLECKFQVEIDPYCQKVLAKHWPHVRRWDDVRTFPPEGDWRVDVICGGDPCQANSIASSPHGSRVTSLGGEFIRVVDALRPRIVVRENTPARSDAPWPWQRVRRELELLGYACLPFRFRACCLGACHRRERVFVLACLPDPNSQRLERIDWQGEPSRHDGGKSGTPFQRRDHLPESLLPGSRAGFPDYVDRVRSLGNAVVPQVAQWIGRRIVNSCA